MEDSEIKLLLEEKENQIKKLEAELSDAMASANYWIKKYDIIETQKNAILKMMENVILMNKSLQ